VKNAPDDPLAEFREEASRLKLTDRATQRLIVAIHREIARNPKVPKADRDHARRKARALERLLRLRREH
jgi:hypothetical protein